MRLWSLHPKYLDPKGIVALWREALLAQKVLAGKTKGYRHHPQLQRFKGSKFPKGAIAFYLRGVLEEAERRGYQFDAKKILGKSSGTRIKVTRGQMKYEFGRLRRKLRLRDPKAWRRIKSEKRFQSHPLFLIEPGSVEPWERVPKPGARK